MKVSVLDHDPIESDHDLISLFEHDLFGKPVPTFPDHALASLAGAGSIVIAAPLTKPT
jgi:hypothetical protein